MEKILRIEETLFSVKNNYPVYEGFQIITDKQTIKIGIDETPQCCENWGYFISNDDISEFIGSDFLGIEIVDTSLNQKKLDKAIHVGFDWASGVMFVNFLTNRGVLQFTVYNDQNGFYGHEAVVVSSRLNHQEIL